MTSCDDLVDVGGLEDGRAAGGDELVVVLRAAFAVDDVRVGELDGGGGLADAGRAEHEQFEAFYDRFGFTVHVTWIYLQCPGDCGRPYRQTGKLHQ